MNSSLTKGHSDGLFMSFFCKKYQHQVADQTFQSQFSNNDRLYAGDEVVYQVTRILDQEMLKHIERFASKYDYRFWLKRDALHFAPIFSEIRRTHWTELADNYS